MRRFALLSILVAWPVDARDIPATHIIHSSLSQPATILIDPWGIAHIYAGNDDDLFFMQGWNAARDRLWQIDVWRRRGLGRMSEVFGERFVEQDRAARLFLYRGDLDVEWKSYGPDAKRNARRFVEGINAYIAELLHVLPPENRPLLARHRPSLPPEFKALNYEPALWDVDDLVRIRSHGLWRNVRSEVERARFVCQSGVEAEARRRPPNPETKLAVPAGLDPCGMPADLLKVYDLATGSVDFSQAESAGSNNWVIAGRRTESKRPILANDPHRALTTPSLRYAVHLRTPTMNVIGAGEPFLPGISIGHNGTAAFGLTIFPTDQEDLYVYTTDPVRPDHYRYGQKWEAMRVVKDRVGKRAVDLKFTRHGPVVYEDVKNHRAYAVRAAWLGPGMLPYFGSLQTMRAKSWEAFSLALRHWGGPSLNHTYADTSGGIAWKAWGRTPVRRNWDGLFPVPGDGRYEWDGFHSFEDFPHEVNPERGWIATANQMNLPPSLTGRRLGFEWSPPWRYQRIESELTPPAEGAVPAHSAELQSSYHSFLAVRLLGWFTAAARRGPADQSDAVEMLTGFHGDLVPESPGAALYIAWKDEVWRKASRRLVPASAGDARGSDEAIVRELATMPEDLRDRLLLDALGAADEQLLKRLGADRKTWALGRLQRTRFDHPLAAVSKEIARQTVPLTREYPRGGDSTTVNVTHVDRDGIHRSGASWRMVIDVGDWDNSLAMNAPGQSGDPSSPHFADLYSRWANDRMFPLMYSDEAVRGVAERKIVVGNGQ